MILVLGVVALYIHDSTAYNRCDPFRVPSFPALSASTFLVVGHIVDLVGTEEIDHVSL